MGVFSLKALRLSSFCSLTAHNARRSRTHRAWLEMEQVPPLLKGKNLVIHATRLSRSASSGAHSESISETTSRSQGILFCRRKFADEAEENNPVTMSDMLRNIAWSRPPDASISQISLPLRSDLMMHCNAPP